ncbi:MAG: sulfatase [Candidatus Omnitrophica bacterium]|nr:sulfatase [Candidatus Omnitrophota bacterium]
MKSRTCRWCRLYLWLGIIGAVCAQNAIAGPATPNRPNVVFVLADQWRAEAFGYAGNTDVRTPHIDRFEREAIHFINAVAGLPVCCPSRASLLTGQRPLTHGVFLNDVPLSTNAVTLAEVLRKAGYDTAYIGKWHLDGDGRSRFIPRERRQGFDYWKAMECTHDYNASFYYADGPEKLRWEGYDAIAQTRDAQRYLRDHAGRSMPFFLFLAWGPPHDPYQTAPQEYRAMYVADKLQLRPNVPQAAESWARKDLAGYYAHCTALDACMGDLRATLRETGLERNTLLVFTSDHGALLGAHGQRKKQQPYDESIRVPLLLRWPDGLGTGPRKFDALVNSEDLMPTILGLCGLTIPKPVEGLDFSAYIRGGPNPSDGAALISCVGPFGEWTRKIGGREYRGIRTLRYTYVRDLNGPWLLFDNQEDPWQLNNLVGHADRIELQAELEALLRRKLVESHDEFRHADYYIRQWNYHVDASGTVPYSP